MNESETEAIAERAAQAAAEAVKLRDAIQQVIMPLCDGKPMGVISAALTGICAKRVVRRKLALRC